MKIDRITKRAIIIGAIVVALALTCIIRLFNMQVVNGEYYRTLADNRTIRTYVTKAPRGEIFDRNGNPIVENRGGYSVQIFKIDIPFSEQNNNINEIIHLLHDSGNDYISSFPIKYNEDEDIPEYSFGTGSSYDEYDEDGLSDEEKKELASLKEQEFNKNIAEWESMNGVGDFKTLREIVRHFEDKYEVDVNLSQAERLDIVAVRYEMDERKFGTNVPFTMASDVSNIVIQKIKEKYAATGFADILADTIRTYSKGNTAAHILGRTGIIYAEEYEELKNDGYGMNDIIGKDGLEAVLEPYLKGKDGYRKVRMTKDGRYSSIVETKQAKAGNYAELTIDLELQEAMEKSLKKNIIDAVDSSGAGAAIAVDPNTGEILAIASYPSYDPEKFNEDYEKLLNQKSNPLFNRALNGVYAPGSTFKILTSIAGLESGLIDPDTYITDRGRYSYYSDYRPTCLAYSSSGVTHGTINVSQAIGVSCNYFFYDIGRRMGIDTIEEYSTKYGLGKTTGIELSESVGVVAGPDEREQRGEEWHPGDVLQSAIGQSDNLFSPAQLASYICTVLNKGKRYGLHLVRQVVDYDTKEIVMSKEPEVMSDNPMSDETFKAVKDGMRRVAEDGTASSVFGNSKLKVGGKTGTAEVSDGRDNVLFTGFAPYDEPEIVVAVVIEHGAKSSFAAQIAKDVFEAYLDFD